MGVHKCTMVMLRDISKDFLKLSSKKLGVHLSHVHPLPSSLDYVLRDQKVILMLTTEN